MKKGMKISKIVTDKYKLRIPPTVYYDLLADVVEAEEEQEPKTGHWYYDEEREATGIYAICSSCDEKIYQTGNFKYCPNCGASMESEEE